MTPFRVGKADDAMREGGLGAVVQLHREAAPMPVPGEKPAPSLESFPLAGDLVQYGTPPEELVVGMLVSGATIVMAGLPKEAQKTWLAMHLAVCVATGQPFLGRSVKQRPVFYCFLEDGRRRVGWRFAKLGLEQGDRAPVRCGFLQDSEALFAALATELAAQELRKAKGEDEQPFLLIVDALINYAYAHGVENENDSIEMSKLIEGLRRFTRESRNSIVLVHHFRRAGDAMRGSGAVQGSSDGWWDLTATADKTMRRIETTLRDLPATTVGFETETTLDGRFRFNAIAAEQLPAKRAPNARPSRRDEVRAEVEKLMKEKPDREWSRNELTERVGSSRNTVSAVLREFADKGRVREGERGWSWVIRKDRTAGENAERE